MAEALLGEGCEIGAESQESDAEVADDPYLVGDAADEFLSDGKTLWDLVVAPENAETKGDESSAGSKEDPYVHMDSMDEGDDEDGGLQDSEDSETPPGGRGTYSTIAMKNATVQKFFVSGLTPDEFVDMNPNILGSTLDEWTEACTKDNWPDFLKRCSPQEATTAKKIPNWYRSVANAVAIAEGWERPFAMKYASSTGTSTSTTWSRSSSFSCSNADT